VVEVLRYFCLVILVLSGLFSGTVTAQTANIDTHASWNQSYKLGTFGGAGTRTYGQTFSVTSESVLSSFSFYMGCNPGDTFHTRIYAWDGTKITGNALFAAPPETAPSGSYTTFLEYSYTPQIRLMPGDYVFFATTTLNSTSTSGSCYWGRRIVDAYTGGSLVFLNSSPLDFSSLSSTSWGTATGDFAFKMRFQAPPPPPPSPPAEPVPVQSQWVFGAMVFLMALFGLRKRLVHPQ